MSKKIKIFRTAVEPVLLYGAETWTLKKADIRALDGVHTRMLRRVFDISWKSHTPNSVIYGKIPSVTDTTVYRTNLLNNSFFRNHPMAIVIEDDRIRPFRTF